MRARSADAPPKFDFQSSSHSKGDLTNAWLVQMHTLVMHLVSTQHLRLQGIARLTDGVHAHDLLDEMRLLGFLACLSG